jgi:hypothetical protein
MKLYMVEWEYTSTQSCTRCRWWWVVTFMLWPLYSRRKSSRYSLNRTLSGSQSQSTLFEGEKNLLPLLEVEWRLLGCTFRSLVAKGTELCRLFKAPCFLINLWTLGKSVFSSTGWNYQHGGQHFFIRLECIIKSRNYGKRTSLPAESMSICLITWIWHSPYNPTYLISTLVIHWFIIRLGRQCGALPSTLPKMNQMCKNPWHENP